MRKLPFSLALLMALGMFFAMTTTASAQEDRISLNAAVGPSFANVGTTFSTVAGVDVRLSDYASLVGEFGMMPHAPFRDAAEIAPPVSGRDLSARECLSLEWQRESAPVPGQPVRAVCDWRSGLVHG